VRWLAAWAASPALASVPPSFLRAPRCRQDYQPSARTPSAWRVPFFYLAVPFLVSQTFLLVGFSSSPCALALPGAALVGSLEAAAVDATDCAISHTASMAQPAP
jgi:hypothetical protein